MNGERVKKKSKEESKGRLLLSIGRQLNRQADMHDVQYDGDIISPTKKGSNGLGFDVFI